MGFIRDNRLIISIYAAIIIGASVFLFYTGKADSYLILNKYHSPFLDGIMKWITCMGDGIFAAVISILFLFYRYRIAIFIGITTLLSGLLAQILKHALFSQFQRPHAFFRELGIEIYRVPHLDIHLNFSFPSGHSATAFALFFGLILFIKNRYLKIIFILLASLTAYSRVYLGQHFLPDIIVGSLIGASTSIILFKFVARWKKKWLDKSILNFTKENNEPT